MLLPALDNASLLKRIRNNASVSNGTATISETEQIGVEVFVCPNNAMIDRKSGRLSFVVNAGYISSEVWGQPETATLFHQPYLINWKGSTASPYRSTDGTCATGNPSSIDRRIALATGVIWRVVGDDKEPVYSSSLDFVSQGDGTSTTMLLSENKEAGMWYCTDMNSIGYGIRIPLASTNYAPRVGMSPPLGEFDAHSSLNFEFPGSTFAQESSESWINAKAIGHLAPRPSSMHAGGVNIIMADGSGKFMNENIDYAIYAKLITSFGINFKEKELQSNAF